MYKVMDCGNELSAFEIQSPYYVHFQNYALGKGMIPFIPPSNGLMDSVKAVLLQGLPCHQINHKDWNVIK